MISTFLKPAIHVNGKKYKVIKQIGEGGFAYVYLVKSTSSSDNRENYALKKMICQLPEQVEEAKKEIDAMVKIKHENVMPLHAFSYNTNKKGQDEALLLMPLFKTSVQSIIDKSGGYPHCGFKSGDEVLHVLRESAKGLLAVHEAGFRHADFKPANILLGETNQVVVTDFGSITSLMQLVENRSDSLQIQDAASRCTTASYRAPELFEPPVSSVIDGKSDVWSFGCAMYCILYSKTPFESGTEGLSTLAVVSGQYSIPAENIWPDDYLHIMRQCLQIDLSQRYSMEELLKALNSLSAPPTDLTIKQIVKVSSPHSAKHQESKGLSPASSSANLAFHGKVDENESFAAFPPAINASTVSFATFDQVPADARTTRNSDQLLALHRSSIDEAVLFGEGTDAIMVDFPSSPTVTTPVTPQLMNARSGNSSTEILNSEEDATSIVFVQQPDLSPLTISQKGSVNLEDSSMIFEDKEDFIPDDFQSAPTANPTTTATTTTAVATFVNLHTELMETLDQKASVEDPFGVDDDDDTFGDFTASTSVTATAPSVTQEISSVNTIPSEIVFPSKKSTKQQVLSIEELPVYDVYNMIWNDITTKDNILKEGTVYTMRLGGFPKKLMRKPVSYLTRSWVV
jgi:serine/threonine kinase 16